MSMSNLVEYKKARANTRRIIKNAKREGWRESKEVKRLKINNGCINQGQ